MRTFFISTLGCKVNQYESEQIAALLRLRGLTQVDRAEDADLRVVNTCSVTIQAASKSRQTVRQLARPTGDGSLSPVEASRTDARSQRVVVTGCWATSDPEEASALPGVGAVLGHEQDIAEALERLLAQWQNKDSRDSASAAEADGSHGDTELPRLASEPVKQDAGADGSKGDTRAGSAENGERIRGGDPAQFAIFTRPRQAGGVKNKMAGNVDNLARNDEARGTISLPQLDRRQHGHQRAFLKIQDGCDAHCTYCIIPRLRPRLWSRGVDDVVAEAGRLVGAGHVELVLTGIFLGAYGLPTALRRRQPGGKPLAGLLDALCTQVAGLRRLRLSSLEPGDLDEELLAVLGRHPQLVPHFHLPLQSGSDVILRRMNRQYRRDDFLRMVERVRAVFDRPALTTDVIVAFPGETDEEFARTLDVVDQAGFIHIHAFPFSPRPGTAAARWTEQFVHGPVVHERINALTGRAARDGLAFRQQFVGETVEVLVERPGAEEHEGAEMAGYQHGRCPRYFSVHFEAGQSLVGQSVRVRIDRVTPRRTFGTLQSSVL